MSSPCTCNAQPLSWSCRCAASLWFRSPRLLRGRSRSAGLRPRGWHAEASGPAATTQRHGEATVNNRAKRGTQQHVSHGRTYVRGALLVGSLRRGRAQGVRLAARGNLAARLLEPPPAPALRGRRVRVVGHALVFV